MKIYEMRVAPNPRRVRMFLAEKDVPMEYVQVDLGSGEHLSEEFRKMNPMGKVPVLELDDGTYLSETMAICRYFEEIQPAPPLLGTDPLERAQIEMWQRQVEFFFFVPSGMCYQHTSGVFAKFRRTFPEWGEANRRGARRYFDFLDNHLENRPFIAGDAFTVADITALCTIDFNKKANKLFIQPEQKNLERWYQEVSGRPSAQA